MFGNFVYIKQQQFSIFEEIIYETVRIIRILEPSSIASRVLLYKT